MTHPNGRPQNHIEIVGTLIGVGRELVIRTTSSTVPITIHVPIEHAVMAGMHLFEEVRLWICFDGPPEPVVLTPQLSDVLEGKISFRNFYFAGLSNRREEFQGYRNQLEWSGWNVTSRWIDRGRPYHSAGLPSSNRGSKHDERLINEDWDDLNRSDAIVLFTDNHLRAEAHHRDVATNYNKLLILVGPVGVIPEDNKSQWFPTWPAFLQSLEKESVHAGAATVRE